MDLKFLVLHAEFVFLDNFYANLPVYFLKKLDHYSYLILLFVNNPKHLLEILVFRLI
jgi:hypothetical protein